MPVPVPVPVPDRGNFTPQAEAYARARPPYPRAIADWILDAAGIGPGDPVAELGAGTGLFTEQLVGRGLQITAIEPNRAMREHAPELRGVTFVEGSFEASGLASGSQALVIGAQAFHWADPPRALPECRRVLRPGGHLAILFNARDMTTTSILRQARAVIDHEVPAFAETYHGVEWAGVLTSTGDFRDVVSSEVTHIVSMTRARFLDLWRSHNQLTAAAGPEGLDRIVNGMERVLADRASVDVSYRCRAWVARAVSP